MRCIDRRWLMAICVAAMTVVAGVCAAEPVVVEPRLIPLAGPLADKNAEVSSLVWHEDTLAILPQDPTMFAPGDTLGFFALRGSVIRNHLNGSVTGPVTPTPFPCVAPGLAAIIRGFDGLEAMGTIGNKCFLTVEAKQDTVMAGYLVCGEYDMRGRVVVMDMTRLTAMPMGVNILDVAEESLLIDGERVITISEANGFNVNPEPRAKVFGQDLEYQGALPFPQVEYRVTDATAVDDAGRFWVMNYFFPPDGVWLEPAPDPEVARHGAPSWLSDTTCIERLLEMQLLEDRIVRTDTPPIWLKPAADGRCRNWEALVRFGDDGFLAMTDQYPGTLFAYIPRPAAH